MKYNPVLLYKMICVIEVGIWISGRFILWFHIQQVVQGIWTQDAWLSQGEENAVSEDINLWPLAPSMH